MKAWTGAGLVVLTASGCADAVGPVGPGGKASVLEVEGIELSSLTVAAEPTAEAGLRLIWAGASAPPSGQPTATPRIDIELVLDFDALVGAALPWRIPIARSEAFDTADCATSWLPAGPQGPIASLRVTRPRSAECAAGSGEQRHQGWLLLSHLDPERIELRLSVDTVGQAPPAEDTLEAEIDAFVDVALP